MFKKTFYVLAVVFVVSIVWFISQQGNYRTPDSITYYDGNGQSQTFQQPSKEDLNAVDNLFGDWRLFQSNVPNDKFPDSEYQSFEYLQTRQALVLSFTDPIEIKGISTKEIHLVDLEDPYLANRVYVKDRADDHWAYIELPSDIGHVFEETIYNLQ